MLLALLKKKRNKKLNKNKIFKKFLKRNRKKFIVLSACLEGLLCICLLFGTNTYSTETSLQKGQKAFQSSLYQAGVQPAKMHDMNKCSD